MTDRITPDFRAEFATVMEKEMTLASNEFFQACMDTMRKHKLLKRVENVCAKYVLPHRENRNRLMLNPVSYTHLTLPTKRIV